MARKRLLQTVALIALTAAAAIAGAGESAAAPAEAPSPAPVSSPTSSPTEAALYPGERSEPASVHSGQVTDRTPRFATGPLGPATASLCGTHGINRTRHAACGVIGILVTVTDKKTKKVVGTAEVGFLWAEALSAKSRTWSMETKIGQITGTGVLKKGATATTVIDCLHGCTSSGAWAKLRMAIGQVYSHAFTISSAGGATDTTRQVPVVTFAHPIAENVAPVVMSDLGPARCDSTAVAGSSGCAFSDVAGTYDVYLTGHNEDAVARNVENGEHNKPAHFGWFGHGSPLTRATAASVARKNRAAACGKKKFKPLTCDEYPFAATFEGAAFFPADNVTVGVPGSQNSAEGGYRVAMYRSERLLNNDPYWVYVLP